MTVSHIQYFDEQCNAYIDLDDEYNSWNDFMLQTYKRLSVRHEPMADGIGTRSLNLPQNGSELTTMSRTDLKDQDGSASDFYEGESVKQEAQSLTTSKQEYERLANAVITECESTEPKMLDLGLRKDTSENEARQALKNAMRLLTKHNLKVTSTVFDVNTFTRLFRRKAAQVVFYGIQTNAVCAAYAYAASFNRIVKKLTVPNIRRLHSCMESELTIRSSYRAGLVEGLRVITPPVSSFMFDPSPCSQTTTELDVEKRKQYEDIVNEERKLGESSQEDLGKEQQERQMQRMNAIILHAKNVGEEVLKENFLTMHWLFQNIKLYKGRKYHLWGVEKNLHAYRRGKRDSHMVDILRRGITTKR
ncbi:hypothetical protein GUITHDRAFT_141166 [Guillardia theta CCMP2712]|uniref:DUF7168 domain-containing protein n=1 Tax=Guillardia theta (strain CCMP2712) TaxID=905079 RepID=L1J1T6_GUITC|nr:hypothetical protein GUITHDRAFT_141166 [Guillardia theta CCMP2712]EKX42493.1 hypothetical protein GUITHDRAFT_141166 [Guillardia theta CCMP2712]|eukprot:XP_005829473.1 hypothetical protein GUITHDRAFT_141166 [Guillardia theta CCMP2712]